MKFIHFFIALFLVLIFSACQTDSSSSYSSVEEASEISLSDFSSTIDESASSESYVGSIDIFNDGNSTIKNIELYGISAEYFNVDSNGIITVSSSARLESSIKEVYTFEAIATNELQESNRANVTITLRGSSLPRLQSVALSVDENASSGTDIGSIIIVEAGDSAIDTIELIGNQASDFDIDLNGTIKVSSAASINFDLKNLYTLEAIATSSLGNSIPSEIMISVNDDMNESDDSNGSDGGGDGNTTGLPLLLIAISFNDYPIEDSAQNWNSKIFGTSFGQANHYYREVSHSRFALLEAKETSGTEDDGIIIVQLGINHPGNNNMNNTHLADAVNLADEYINFAQYDLNKNDNIEVDELQIMFIIGGGETAYGDSVDSSTWAHASGLSSFWTVDNEAPPLVDGVTIMDFYAGGRYSRFGEKHADHFATIGVIVHELGHAIWGLPDLYDRDQSSAGIGYFGLMAAGSWTAKNGELPGATPPHMCAWSKLQIEWAEAEVVTTTEANISIHANHTSASNIIKIETANPKEYFLIENRSPVGYDAALYRMEGIDFEGGLAIWHIDDGQRSSQNDYESRKLVDLEEANSPELDSSSYSRGKRANLFYAGNKIVFDATSSPNSNNNDGLPTGLSISNISAVGSASQEYIMYIDISKE